MNLSDQIKSSVEKKASELMEIVDSVQVFVTWHDGGEEKTHAYEHGKGNFYARQAQVQEFLTIQQQYQRNWAIKKDNEE